MQTNGFEPSGFAKVRPEANRLIGFARSRFPVGLREPVQMAANASSPLWSLDILNRAIRPWRGLEGAMRRQW
jgi:hypothetical protein